MQFPALRQIICRWQHVAGSFEYMALTSPQTASALADAPRRTDGIDQPMLEGGSVYAGNLHVSTVLAGDAPVTSANNLVSKRE